MEQKEKKKKKPNRIIGEAGCLPVFRGGIVYFRDYLKEYIGGNWWEIKEALKDAGYHRTEILDYRDRLVNDFYSLCDKHGITGIIT